MVGRIGWTERGAARHPRADIVPDLIQFVAGHGDAQFEPLRRKLRFARRRFRRRLRPDRFMRRGGFRLGLRRVAAVLLGIGAGELGAE